MTNIRITETLDIDLDREMWCCKRCGKDIYSARDSYLRGCLVYERPAAEIYGPPIPVREDRAAISYSPESDFMRVVELYCPECGSMITVQYLPPGHPLVTDIELDVDKLKEKARKGPA